MAPGSNSPAPMESILEVHTVQGRVGRAIEFPSEPIGCTAGIQLAAKSCRIRAY